MDKDFWQSEYFLNLESQIEIILNDISFQTPFKMDYKLRDYQHSGIKEIFGAWENNKSILFQMPTGTGKTSLFCEIVKKFITTISPSKKVLIITHRKELVDQIHFRLKREFNLSSGIISSNFKSNISLPVQVASIQTLIRRSEHQNDIFSLVIIDEAHHALASTYKQLWKFYPNSKFLGVTATPIRTNGEGFQDLFDKLITSNSIKWFIQNNYLSDIKYYASHTPDVSNIRLIAGDYDENELSEVMQDNNVMADLVQSYIECASEKKIIVFTVNRAHCNRVVQKFNDNGLNAKSIDTYTSSYDRNSIVNDFRNNKFKILCNVNIFTEGFDCPDVDAIQLARPTKSLTLFLQQVGRCMRPHHNKQNGIILDNASLWKEHGLPKMDRNWLLNGSKEINSNVHKEIIGIREVTRKENNEPRESKSIRLAEIGELEIDPSIAINYDKIENNLIDKKILTMRERMEHLIKNIEKYEQRKINETEDEFKDLLDKKIKDFKEELFELQENLRPKRFEQVLDLIIEKCYKIIDSNDIFVENDKELFLERFIEPYLKLRVEEQIKYNGEKEINYNLGKKEKAKILKVKFPDGLIIEENTAKKTLIKTLEVFDIEKLKNLPSIFNGAPLLSDNEEYAKNKDYALFPGTNFYIYTKTNTQLKKKWLDEVGKTLGIGLVVKIVEK